MSEHRVALHSTRTDCAQAIRNALDQAGILARLAPTSRVALKPNLTYPYHKPGITTSPEVMREAIRVLHDYTKHIAIVESDGGYGHWTATEAFRGHHLEPLREEFGVELVNLCDEERELITFRSRGREYQLPLPTRLLHNTDLFITMPVPKIHCMTGLTLAHKNQWGCIPDTMRMRRHYIFNDAIVAINKVLRPAVLGDGTYFLDRNGPMEGDPVRMDMVIAASDVGTFDRYVSQLMKYPWQRVPHLKQAVALGCMPADLAEIMFNVHPDEASTHTFRLVRTARNFLQLSGFKSRFLTWLGWESWFGRVVLHSIMYAVIGRPGDPKKAPAPHP